MTSLYLSNSVYGLFLNTYKLSHHIQNIMYLTLNAIASLHGQKEAKSLNPLSGNIKVTIPNGICKVYDIIPAPFSLIESFIKIQRSLAFQRKPFKEYWKN